MTESSDFDARQALCLYGLEKLPTRLIRHNENRTFCVDGQYLLRIHRPRKGFTMAQLYEGVDPLQMRQEELRFLKHLRGCGLPVQSPVLNRRGESVSVLPDGTLATVLTWLPGEILKKESLSPELCRSIGAMVGRLHGASRSFQAAGTLRYDRALCLRLKRWAADLCAQGRLSPRHGDAFCGALEEIGQFLEREERDFLLLHTDLSLSNMLLTEEGVVPIDFSLMGVSHPALDLGGLYGCISDPALRRAILEGYGEACGRAVPERQVQMALALQVLLAIMLHFELWCGEAWFAEKLEDWCANLFAGLE